MNAVKELKQTDVQTHQLSGHGNIPNNKYVPLLVYRKAIQFDEAKDPGSTVESIFHENDWTNSWHDGIYKFHHYHSNTHEVLGIYRGIVKVQLGGPEGITTELGKGDVVVIPAGVAHKNLGSSGDFACVGAYPGGQSYDMNYGKDGERPGTDHNIGNVPLPQKDPVYGKSGPLFDHWYK